MMSGGSNKKRARQAYKPARKGKHPRQFSLNIHAMKFQWRVENIDLDGEWGWNGTTIQELFRKIIPKLHHYETMKWDEIEGRGSHFVDYDQLCKPAQGRLVDLGLSDISQLFSLRMDGSARIWGQRDVARLNLLWWDPDYQVCPSHMRHT